MVIRPRWAASDRVASSGRDLPTHRAPDIEQAHKSRRQAHQSVGLRIWIEGERRAEMIEGELVNLRPYDMADLERDLAWINDREVTRFLTTRYPFSRAAA